MATRQKAINATLAVLAVGVAAAAALTVGPSSTAKTAPTTTTVNRGVVQSTVTASGNVQSPHSVSINFKSGGRLTAIYVRPGQRVQRGTLLARVVDTSSQQTLRSAEANRKNADALRLTP